MNRKKENVKPTGKARLAPLELPALGDTGEKPTSKKGSNKIIERGRNTNLIDSKLSGNASRAS